LKFGVYIGQAFSFSSADTDTRKVTDGTVHLRLDIGYTAGVGK